MRSLKREPTGHGFLMLNSDGVLRQYHSDTYEVIDAVRLSPAHIKEFLDEHVRPFDQAEEDRLRGVDGRRVPDEELLNPSEAVRPKRPTEEEFKERRRRVDEENARRADDAKNGVVYTRPPRGNYNLEPLRRLQQPSQG